MAYRCDNCGKKTQYGQTGRHHRGVAGSQWKKRAQKTKRVFRPNLHSAKILVAGDWVKMKLCTKCLRKLKGQNARSKSKSKILKVAAMI